MSKIIELFRFIVTVLFLASCGNPYKQLAKIEYKHPLQFSEYVSRRFEPVIQVRDSFIYLKGKDSVRVDTLDFNVDSLLMSLKSGNKTIKRPCPPCIIPRDTFLRLRTIEKENKALVNLLEIKERQASDKLIEAKKELEGLRKSNKNLLRTIAVCIGLLAVSILLIFRR